MRTGTSGDCPLFGKAPLASTNSSGDGRFSLAIDKEKRTYTVTYCVNGYVPRADRDLPNTANGTPVIPNPARLWPVTVKPTEAAFHEAIERRVLASMNDLAYLHSVSPEQFGRGMSDLARTLKLSSDNDAAVVDNLSRLVQSWDRDNRSPP
jgi:hypothetical protein